MPRALILGTGTGVGKTAVAVALLRALRARDPNATVLGFKPVETGVVAGVSTDAERLSASSSHPIPAPPFRLALAVSPHLASREANTRITLDAILDYMSDKPYNTLHSTWSIIEAAGGAFTPLAPGLTNADLAIALQPAPWILVVADRLGALHETRSTLLAAAAVGLTPPLVVLRRPELPDASTWTNASELRALDWADALDGADDVELASQLIERLTSARLGRQNPR